MSVKVISTIYVVITERKLYGQLITQRKEFDRLINAQHYLRNLKNKKSYDSIKIIQESLVQREIDKL